LLGVLDVAEAGIRLGQEPRPMFAEAIIRRAATAYLAAGGVMEE
jgi:hypothetical protein